MSEIEKALKTEQEEFYISNEERKQLIDMLTMTSVALRLGKLWFNKPSKEYNKQFADFAETMAKRFANMPVHEEN
jgi:uncharacterized protein YccT (UPF0319 family)